MKETIAPNVFIGPNVECMMAMHRQVGVKLWLHRPEVSISDGVRELLKKTGIEQKTFTSRQWVMEVLQSLGPSNYLQMFGFPYRLPQGIIDQFQRVYNLHPGSLENCRGAEPIHHTILRSDSHFTLTLHEVPDEEFDSGPVCQTAFLPVEYEASFIANCTRLTALSCGLLTAHYLTIRVTPRPPSIQIKQAEGSYLPKLSNEIIAKIEKVNALKEVKSLNLDDYKQQIKA